MGLSRTPSAGGTRHRGGVQTSDIPSLLQIDLNFFASMQSYLHLLARRHACKATRNTAHLATRSPTNPLRTLLVVKSRCPTSSSFSAPPCFNCTSPRCCQDEMAVHPTSGTRSPQQHHSTAHPAGSAAAEGNLEVQAPTGPI
jgi:hypothetical protein